MAKILGIGSLNTSIGTEKLVALKDRHFYVFNPTTSNWDKQSGAGVNLTDQIRAYHEEFLDMQFWVNGTDANRTFDSSSWSVSTNIVDSPIAKYIKLFVNNKLYLGNLTIPVGSTNVSFPSRIWFSNLPQQDSNGDWVINWNLETGDDLDSTAGSAVITSAGSAFETRGIVPGNPFYIISGDNAKKYIVSSVDSETQITLTENVTNSTANQSFWVGGNWLDIRSEDGDVITGVGENADNILLFKKNSLFRFDGSDELEKVRGVPGTTSQNSVVNLQDFTFYFHSTGIWRYNGFSAELISEPIWDIIEAISSSNYSQVIAWTDRARFVKFFVGDLAENKATGLPAISNAVLVYDLELDLWSTQSLLHSVSAATNWDESEAPKIYAGFTDGHVYQLESGNDYAGGAISFRLQTHAYYPIAPEATIDMSRIEIFADRGEGLEFAFKRRIQPNQEERDYHAIDDEFPVDMQETRGVEFEIIESSKKPSFLLEGWSLFWSGGRLEK